MAEFFNIVAFTLDEDLILKPSMEGKFLILPCGSIQDGSLVERAKFVLKQRTGYESDLMEVLPHQFYMSSGSPPTWWRTVVARNCILASKKGVNEGILCKWEDAFTVVKQACSLVSLYEVMRKQ